MRDNKGQWYRQYAFLTAPSARSGNMKAEQVFVCLTPFDWDFSLNSQGSENGLVLQLQTLVFYEPPESCHLPRQPEMSGRLRMFTSDQFAAYLLDLPIKIDSELDAVEVNAFLMDFKDILPSRVLITGSDDSIPKLTATETFSPLDQPDGDGSDSNSDQDGGGDVPKDTAGEGVQPEVLDLLSLLESTESSEPKQKKSRMKSSSKKKDDANKTSEKDSTVKGRGDPILDDPCLKAFLSASDISALQSAREQCKSFDLDCHDWDHADAVGQESDDGAGDDDQIEEIETLEQPAETVATNRAAATASTSSSSSSSHQPSDPLLAFF